MVTTRFAPSPTGHLHVGNIRTALVCWLAARRAGGRFLLRLDDTDRARSSAAFADAIRADLRWLGLVPDAEVRQSDRAPLYDAAFARLRDAGHVYPCYETEEELSVRRRVALGRGLPPRYDRAALALSDADRAALEAGGLAPHWRFRLDGSRPIAWDDRIRGAQRFDPAALSDPVVLRADGSWLYLLPSVIDDIDMRISDVVRGEDHVSNTAIQLQMFEALGAEPPAFAHMALLVGADGKLSKRTGAIGLGEIRERGIEPQALLALLARLGTSEPVAAVAETAVLIDGFDFAQWGRAPARFDAEELAQINARTLHMLPYAAVADRLPAGMDEAAWAAIRPNLAKLADARDWWGVVTQAPPPAAFEAADRAYLALAADTLAAMAWGETPWATLTATLKPISGRSGRALFLPLRRALTGRGHGPDMAALLPLIGREPAVARLRAAADAGATRQMATGNDAGG